MKQTILVIILVALALLMAYMAGSVQQTIGAQKAEQYILNSIQHCSAHLVATTTPTGISLDCY